ncbi:MAG: hypothetical protein WCL39_13540 [Armatimonadota bacterium]
MHCFLLIPITAFALFVHTVQAAENTPNKAITDAKAKLIGDWRLVDGPPEMKDPKNERVWTFNKDDSLHDSKEEKGMKYYLVQNAKGEIWALMLYSLSDSGPLVMRVRFDGEALKLDYVGESGGGTYGANPDGGLTFTKKKGEQPGAAQPATQPAQKGPVKEQPPTQPSKDAHR